MIIPDGTESRRGFRVRTWILKLILGSVGVVLIGIVMFFAFYSTMLSRAAMTEQLRAENQQLLRYQYKVDLLEENLGQAREIVGRLTELAGIDFQFPDMPDDSTLFASLDVPKRAVLPRPPVPDWTVPTGLPIQGPISQEFEPENNQRFHPGIDIACAEGTPVLATAAGVVIVATFDSIYGYMVIVEHNDTMHTVYGHNRELLVETGRQVLAGGRIAMSGNTGKSTAPHVHYEVRINNQPVNPLE